MPKEEFTNKTRIMVSWISKEDILKMVNGDPINYKQVELLVNELSYEDLELIAADLSSYTHPVFQYRLIRLIEEKRLAKDEEE